MKINKKFWENKRTIVELIWVSVFAFFAVQFLGIPDKYDTYIYFAIAVVFIVSIFIYLRFIIKELREILNEDVHEK